jgi:hypothetical protein
MKTDLRTEIEPSPILLPKIKEWIHFGLESAQKERLIFRIRTAGSFNWRGKAIALHHWGGLLGRYYGEDEKIIGRPYAKAAIEIASGSLWQEFESSAV